MIYFYLLPLIICIAFTIGLHSVRHDIHPEGGPVTNWEMIQIWVYSILPGTNILFLVLIIVAAIYTWNEHDKNEKQKAKRAFKK